MFFATNLRRRCCRPELIDQPDLEEARHRGALRGLERINFWSGSARLLWRPVRALSREYGPAALRVLDIATGAGDVPIRLWRKAKRAGVHLVMEACDINPRAIAYARSRAKKVGAEIRFFVADALADAPPGRYDVVCTSLFLHHLADEQAVLLLRRMAQVADRMVLVNDLRRCLAGYVLAWVGTRVLSRSRVVHADGPQSVAAAFRPKEVLALAERAGLMGTTVARRWPCRYLMSWRK
jgi:2-polyprenyl-3-methyl-5-hydroxy-6-metoxy-1,4-benzoquinol methylase